MSIISYKQYPTKKKSYVPAETNKPEFCKMYKLNFLRTSRNWEANSFPNAVVNMTNPDSPPS